MKGYIRLTQRDRLNQAYHRKDSFDITTYASNPARIAFVLNVIKNWINEHTATQAFKAKKLLIDLTEFSQSSYCPQSFTLNQFLMKRFMEFLLHKNKDNPDFWNVSLMDKYKYFTQALKESNVVYHWEIPPMLRNTTDRFSIQDQIYTDSEIEQFWKIRETLIRLPISRKRKTPDFNSTVVTLDKLLVSIYTGARREEVPTCFITFDSTEKMEVIGIYGYKSKEVRFVPMHPRIKPVIEHSAYKSKRFYWNGLKPWLKIEGSGQVIFNVGDTTRRELWPRENIVCFHSGRKTFIVRLLEAGLDIYKVAKLAGHSNVGTTEKYYACIRHKKLMEETRSVMARIA